MISLGGLFLFFFLLSSPTGATAASDDTRRLFSTEKLFLEVSNTKVVELVTEVKKSFFPHV